MILLSLLLTTMATAKPEPKNLPACGRAKDIAAADAKITELQARGDSLVKDAESAPPAKCGKGLPEPAIHARLKDYAEAAHGLTVQLMKVKKETGSKACRTEIETYLKKSEAEQRRVYERVEQTCR